MPESVPFQRTSCSAKSATQRASTIPLKAVRGKRNSQTGIRRRRRRRDPGGPRHLVQEEMDQLQTLKVKTPALSLRLGGWWPGEW